jgi:hypothetical protein
MQLNFRLIKKLFQSPTKNERIVTAFCKWYVTGSK